MGAKLSTVGWKRNGATRTVFLTKNYAFKIPGIWKYDYKWASFIKGLLANMQEKQLHTMSPRFCPVLFRLWGGFLIVMPRCQSMTDEEWKLFEYEDFIYDFTGSYGAPLPVEYKRCSIKKLNNQIVAVDYGQG